MPVNTRKLIRIFHELIAASEICALVATCCNQSFGLRRGGLLKINPSTRRKSNPEQARSCGRVEAFQADIL